MEERHINPETLVKDKERKEFLRFVEDFNTGKIILLDRHDEKSRAD